jgi:DNA polymerase-1
MFSSERRKAKILNFSIAYGKTAHGLSKDWNVTLKEAEETVERWYAERAEVRTWQQEQHALALSEGYVCTILGRRRQLPGAKSKNKALRSHSLRAAINTPIQGSAADVATAAMLRINSNEKLKELGWKLLLQVHDEVILEGPKESAPEAQSIVLSCMRSPFGEVDYDPLCVELSVDSKYAETWYEAK